MKVLASITILLLSFPIVGDNLSAQQHMNIFEECDRYAQQDYAFCFEKFKDYKPCIERTKREVLECIQRGGIYD